MSTYTPVAPGERIQSLDVLRGFALLGILVMNVQSFSMPTAAYVNPTAWGDLTGINLAVWLASHVLADQKFMTLFSMLFGAGVCLFADRAEARSGRSAAVHYRRMFWLLVFGLLHVYFLWTGDILVPYAICGCGIYLFRNRSPRRLLVLGICVFSVGTFLDFFFAWGLMNYASPEAVAGVASFWAPDAAAIEAELAAYQGGWMAQQAYRVRAALEMHTFVMPMFMLWPCGGAMLVGMALYKWGVLSAARSVRFYRRMIVIGMAVGLTAIGAGVWWEFFRRLDLAAFFLHGGAVQLLGECGRCARLSGSDHVDGAEGSFFPPATLSCRCGQAGVHELHPANRFMHATFLWAWVRAVRECRALPATLCRTCRMAYSVVAVARLVAALRVRPAGMGVARTDVLVHPEDAFARRARGCEGALRVWPCHASKPCF